MRPVRAVGLYLVFVFVGGALVAPWLYGLIQSVGGWLPSLQGLGSKPFPRYVGRALMILALIGLPFFLRQAGFSSWRALGLPRRSDAGFQLLRGFSIGLVSLACVVAIALGAGARELSRAHGWADVLIHLAKAGLAAALVAPLEEIFFRGALFGALRKVFHWSVALGLSSALYALLHFLERGDSAGPVRWFSGFLVLGGMVAGFGDWTKVIPGFLNLTLVGLILGLAYQRSGALHFSIGLHSGWIFWLKTYGFVTDDTVWSRPWLFGTSKLIDGWLAFVMLAILLTLLTRLMPQADPQVGWKEKKLLS